MEQHTRLIEFRQALYDTVFTRERDALMELLDALLLSPTVCSFPYLTLSPAFRRSYSSAYKALNRGYIDRAALLELVVKELPDEVSIFPIDESAWPRPEAVTVEDRGFVHGAPQGIDHSGVVIGHSYSVLAYVAEGQSSWALPLSCKRIPTDSDAITIALEQIAALQRLRQKSTNMPIYCADSRYGNTRFLGGIDDGAAVTRLRSNRVLYRDPGPYSGRGRPPIHGAPFRFNDETSWGNPDQEERARDPRYGDVLLRLWHGLHMKKDATVRFSVLGAWVHQEKAHRPRPIWLAFYTSGRWIDEQQSMSAFDLWHIYRARTPLESSFRFRKRYLNWLTPRLASLDGLQRWSDLVSIAQWVLWLSREQVGQQVLPWQREQARLTPERVLQSLAGLFAQIGTPAQSPKPRGKSPGWPKGRDRPPRIRHPVVKKGKKQRKKPG